MLVMTCEFGGLIRIGEQIQVTLRGRDRDRVAVSVVAPSGSELVFDGAVLNPFPMPNGRASYCFSLRQVRRFRVDDVQVMVWLPGDTVPLAAECIDSVHVGIATTNRLNVSYEYDGCDPMTSRLSARHFWN